MPGATSQITVANTQYTAVVTRSVCRIVRITENRAVVGYPTADFLIAKPTSGDTPVQLQAGAQYEFSAEAGQKPFGAGMTVGYRGSNCTIR